MKSKITNRYVWHLVASRSLASIGSSLTSFGIDVWFYRKTGNYTNFAIIYLLSTLPPIFISPIAGFVSDQVHKPIILFFSEIGALTITLILATGYYTGNLGFALIAACVFAMAVASEFRYTAMMALIPELSAKTELSTVNGLQQAFRGVIVISGPLLGAVGYEYFGLPTLLLGGASLYLYTVLVAWRLIPLNRPKVERSTGFGLGQFISQYAIGLRWLRSQPYLRSLLWIFILISGLVATFSTLVVPHVLDANKETWLAPVLMAQGMGVLMAGIALARFGSFGDENIQLITGCVGLGFFVMMFGLASHPAVLASMSFFVGISIALVSSANQTIWQSRTPQGFQGKMVALRSMTLYISSPFAIYLSASLSGFAQQVVLTIHVMPSFALRWSSIILLIVGTIIMTAGIAILCRLKKYLRLQSLGGKVEHESNQVA